MYEIIPSPGPQKEWHVIEERIQQVQSFAKTIHIDILDGKFANNTTFLSPEPFKKYTENTFFELHLMVENPIQYLAPFAAAGFKRFIGQVEKMPDIAAFVAKGQELGEVGLAIDGKTSLDSLHVSFNDIDALLVMTINAGFSGQPFLEEKLEKVKTVREQSFLPIEVDGGVNDETIILAKTAGATRFVATSFLFKANPEEQFTLLQKHLSLH